MSVVTPESLHARNEALQAENERLAMELAETQISYAELLGKNECLMAQSKGLGMALNQAVTHARPELPTPQDRAKLQLSEDSVLFLSFGGFREWHECPELAVHLRSMEGHQ